MNQRQPGPQDTRSNQEPSLGRLRLAEQLADRTWVLLTEAPDGGWGLAGRANTNLELVAAARAQLADLQARAREG